MKAWRSERRDYPYDRDCTGTPEPFGWVVTVLATVAVIVSFAVMLGGL